MRVLYIFILCVLSCDSPTSNLFFNRNENYLIKENKFVIYTNPISKSLSTNIKLLNDNSIKVTPVSSNETFVHGQNKIYYEFVEYVTFEKIKQIVPTINFEISFQKGVYNEWYINKIDTVVLPNGTESIQYDAEKRLRIIEPDSLNMFESLRDPSKNVIQISKKGSNVWEALRAENISDFSGSVDKYKIRILLNLYSGLRGYDLEVVDYTIPHNRWIVRNEYNEFIYLFKEINFLVMY